MKAKTIRINNRTYNLGTLLWLLLFCAVNLVIIIDSAVNFHMLITWDNGGVCEYQGSYQFSTKRYPNNTSYIFLLENGDTIQIPCEYIVDNDYVFDNSEPLKFRYLAHKSIFHPKAHTGVEISTVDNSCTFLQEEDMKSNIFTMSMVFSILCILCVLLLTLPFWFNIYLRLLKLIRSLRKT